MAEVSQGTGDFPLWTVDLLILLADGGQVSYQAAFCSSYCLEL